MKATAKNKTKKKAICIQLAFSLSPSGKRILFTTHTERIPLFTFSQEKFLEWPAEKDERITSEFSMILTGTRCWR